MSKKVKWNDESNVTEVKSDDIESGESENLKKCDNDKSNLKGAIEESGTNVHCHGPSARSG